ncbi:fumarylacetoacetate hydrolase family protein [bacterium]|nr:fumarylacetoacetate hydrolase family protein [bacterium]
MSYICLKKSGERIAVSKILCVGANYSDHIAEMNPGKPAELPKEPVIFMKPPSAIIRDGENIIFPDVQSELHHEVELIVVIGKDGKNIKAADADSHILGYGVGLDMTLRDLQAEAKKKGRPWTIAKGFDTSAVLSDVVLKNELIQVNDLTLKLFINDVLRQEGHTSNMIFKVSDIIVYLSQFFTLCRGDVIFTGTPKGVGPVQSGDRLRAVLGEYAEVIVSVKKI